MIMGLAPNLVVQATKITWRVFSTKQTTVDRIYAINENVVVAYEQGKVVLLDGNLKVVKRTSYTEAEMCKHGMIVVGKKKNGSMKYGIINKKGKLLVPLKYTTVLVDEEAPIAIAYTLFNDSNRTEVYNQKGKKIMSAKNQNVYYDLEKKCIVQMNFVNSTKDYVRSYYTMKGKKISEKQAEKKFITDTKKKEIEKKWLNKNHIEGFQDAYVDKDRIIVNRKIGDKYYKELYDGTGNCYTIGRNYHYICRIYDSKYYSVTVCKNGRYKTGIIDKWGKEIMKLQEKEMRPLGDVNHFLTERVVNLENGETKRESAVVNRKGDIIVDYEECFIDRIPGDKGYYLTKFDEENFYTKLLDNKGKLILDWTDRQVIINGYNYEDTLKKDALIYILR